MNHTFEELKAARVEHGEHDDCTVIAWCALTGDDYGTAQYILSELAHRKFRNGPHWPDYLHAWRAMGYSLVRLTEYTAKTMVTLAREFPRGRYLVGCSAGKHVAALIDGRFIDFTNGRRHHIYNVWELS